MEEHVDDGDFQRFQGIEEENIYNKWLMKKILWAKKKVILIDFPYSEIVNLINSRGWQKVAGKLYLAYPLLVKEFIANFNHAIEELEVDHRYITWVYGKWIKFIPSVIEHYYELTANDIEHVPSELDMTLVT
ncbi:Uncharacterized protein Adt_31181 [Abeliophyllum distichum]|uniref:Uncharacterized protein n=1 Tax=Abeliophyllum distichum TaxID=126358 RepID=A0ABD1RDE4_9LAMI